MSTNELFGRNPWLAGLQYWENYMRALGRYADDFTKQTMQAGKRFQVVEERRSRDRTGEENHELYWKLIHLSNRQYNIGMSASLNAGLKFHTQQFWGFMRSIYTGNGLHFLEDQSRALEVLASFDKLIADVEPEFGFHFDDGNYRRDDETPRSILYQVWPYINGETRYDLVNESLKPIVIVPPHVLGANILCFLRNHGKSYVHSFANKRIPTYVRIMKPINKTPAVARMTQEDDCLDTKYFCEKVARRHGRMVSLNGYCQAGYGAVVNWLSGMLDDSVDAVITCVAPMDGTSSRGLSTFLKDFPPEFNDLAYGGEKVSSGEGMSLVYKLKSLDNQAPFVAFINDLQMVLKALRDGGKLSLTVPALHRWLYVDRVDIPRGITKVSFDSYNTPITADGTLPVRLFGKKLNLGRFKEKGCTLANFYAPKDDLVEQEVALAAKKWATFVEEMEGGHVKKATSPFQKEGGPERFHLGLAHTPVDISLLSQRLLHYRESRGGVN